MTSSTTTASDWYLWAINCEVNPSQFFFQKLIEFSSKVLNQVMSSPLRINTKSLYFTVFWLGGSQLWYPCAPHVHRDPQSHYRFPIWELLQRIRDTTIIDVFDELIPSMVGTCMINITILVSYSRMVKWDILRQIYFGGVWLLFLPSKSRGGYFLPQWWWWWLLGNSRAFDGHDLMLTRASLRAIPELEFLLSFFNTNEPCVLLLQQVENVRMSYFSSSGPEDQGGGRWCWNTRIV